MLLGLLGLLAAVVAQTNGRHATGVWQAAIMGHDHAARARASRRHRVDGAARECSAAATTTTTARPPPAARNGAWEPFGIASAARERQARRVVNDQTKARLARLLVKKPQTSSLSSLSSRSSEKSTPRAPRAAATARADVRS